MLPFLVLLVSLLGAESQAVFYELEDAEYHFEQFIVTFNKTYPSEEEKNYRFNIFKENLKKINAQNAEGHATFGITKFADLSTKELKQKYSRPKSNIGIHWCTNEVGPNKTAPDSWDWRDKGVISKVKDQGECNSGYAFGAIGNLEAVYAMKHNTLLELSAQQLLDCDVTNDGCYSGSHNYALVWLAMNGGSMKEDDYPYQAIEGECKFDKNKAAVNVTDCFFYMNITEDQLKQIVVDKGPIVIDVNAEPLYNYDGGILECPDIGYDPHTVLIVGYGKEGDKPYWLIKNSWGTEWGEEGYLRLAMYKNSCDMLFSLMAGGIVA